MSRATHPKDQTLLERWLASRHCCPPISITS
jgi:hypothetical protein